MKKNIAIYISNKKLYFLNVLKIQEKNLFVTINGHKKRIIKNGLFNEINIVYNYLKKFFKEEKIQTRFLDPQIIIYIDVFTPGNKEIIEKAFQKLSYTKINVKPAKFLDNKYCNVFITNQMLIIRNNNKIINTNIFFNKDDKLNFIIKYLQYLQIRSPKSLLIYGDSILVKKIKQKKIKILYINDFKTLVEKELTKSIQNY